MGNFQFGIGFQPYTALAIAGASVAAPLARLQTPNPWDYGRATGVLLDFGAVITPVALFIDNYAAAELEIANFSADGATGGATVALPFTLDPRVNRRKAWIPWPLAATRYARLRVLTAAASGRLPADGIGHVAVVTEVLELVENPDWPALTVVTPETALPYLAGGGETNVEGAQRVQLVLQQDAFADPAIVSQLGQLAAASEGGQSIVFHENQGEAHYAYRMERLTEASVVERFAVIGLDGLTFREVW